MSESKSESNKRKTIWKPCTSPFVTRELLLRFFMMYGDKYPEDIRQKIKDNLFKKIGSYWNPIELFQIYSYTGVFGPDNDIYYGYLKKLVENFDVNCNVLDVASGYIPAFGTIVAGKQLELPNSRGKVTVCDPAILLDKAKYSNMIIKKEKFSSDNDLTSYDLITGIMPCEATWDLIKASCEQEKDFYIGLCGCAPDDYDFEDGISYLDKNLEYARKKCSEYGRDLIETKLDSDYYVSLPVIYSKKTKKMI